MCHCRTLNKKTCRLLERILRLIDKDKDCSISVLARNLPFLAMEMYRLNKNSSGFENTNDMNLGIETFSRFYLEILLAMTPKSISYLDPRI